MPLPIVHHPDYDAKSVSDDHRFPMRKFARVAEQLVEDGLVAPGGFYEPIHAPQAWLELVHTPRYVDGVLNQSLSRQEMRRIGFDVTSSVSQRSRAAVSGTVLTARLALEHGAACNTAGGSHHAHADFGAGFCVFNDVGVAARLLLEEGQISSALILDCDVHQGDGTARMFETMPDIVTVSIHCEENWPVRKANSDHDIGLPEGTGDAVYLEALERTLTDALERYAPDIVFYNAGVDPHIHDRLGKFALTDHGIAVRDARVFELCAQRDIPVAGVLGGGYSQDIHHLAGLHTSLHRGALASLKPVPISRD